MGRVERATVKLVIWKIQFNRFLTIYLVQLRTEISMIMVWLVITVKNWPI